MSSEPRQVLIMGRPRTGTTLVSNLLNSQPRSTVLSDLLSTPLMEARRRGGFERALTAVERNRCLFAVKWELRATSRRLEVGPDGFRTLAELYDRALRALGSPGDHVVGHKIAGLEQVLPQVLEQTAVRCIYVVRDVRDVALSQWNVSPRGITLSIYAWKQGVQIARSLAPHPRLLLLRFEDLVTDPARAVRPVEALLGRPVRTDLEELRHDAAPWIENSAFHDVERVLDPRPSGRWRREPDHPLVRHAAWACASELEQLGYDAPDLSALTWRDRGGLVATRVAVAALKQGGRGARAAMRLLLTTFPAVEDLIWPHTGSLLRGV
jgi:hypothetical protein